MSVKEMMQPAQYEQLRTLIRACFPDPTSPLAVVTDAIVDSFVANDWASSTFTAAQRQQLGIPAPPAGWVKPPPALGTEESAVVGYYVGNAQHSRTKGGQTRDWFVGHLPLARVRLAATDRSAISTRIGVVDSTTSLYLTVAEFNDRLANTPGFKQAGAVEVITPPRMGGERFAAVAVYLSYANAGDATPQAFVLEAGLAQGGPRVPFYGKAMDTVIVQQTNYQPTPFSTPSHWYRGRLTVQNNEPVALKVEVFVDAQLQQQYMQVDVSYDAKTSESVPVVSPAVLRAEAALRVASIAQMVGVNIGVPGFVQAIMGAAGQVLPWGQRP
jgi:hypothetical protein